MNAEYKVWFADCDGLWLATCPDLGVTGSGFSKEEAFKSVMRSMKVELQARAESLAPQFSLSAISSKEF